MEIKEIINEVIAGLIVLIIASLIGYFFKGRFIKLLNKFFNRKDSIFLTLLAYILELVPFVFSAVFGVVYVAKVEDLVSVFYVIVIIIIFTFFVALITRDIIYVGEKTTNCTSAVLKERKFFLSVYGTLEFVCEIEGVRVAFYYIGKVAHYIPLDINEVDYSKWEKIEKLLDDLRFLPADKLKSALGCG